MSDFGPARLSDPAVVQREAARGRRLVRAGWVALAAAAMIFLGGALTVAAVASSHEWGPIPAYGGRLAIAYGRGRVVSLGGLAALRLAVLVIVAARNLRWRPGAALVVFLVVAAGAAALGVVLLVDSSLLIGPVGYASDRAGSGLSDGALAGIGLLTASALLVVAAALTLAACAPRRRAA